MEEEDEQGAHTTQPTVDETPAQQPVKQQQQPRSHRTAAVAAAGGKESLLEGEEENFMTASPKEKAAWVKMMKSRHAALVKREQDSKKWHEGLLQRRVEIYNRSRKLLNSQRDRFRFIFKMSEIVKNLSEKRQDNGGVEGNSNINAAERNVVDDDDKAEETPQRNANVDENDDSAGPDIVGERETIQENNEIEGGNSVPTILVHEPSEQ